MPDDTLIALSDTSYSNDDTSLGWLAHFERFTSRRKTGAYRLLLLDGFGSHCTKQFIDYCNRYNIILFCFPPHTTHLLQPLDVVFQPYKHYHAEAVEQATRTGCSDFNNVELLHALRSIREPTFKKNTILTAFRKTGLLPFAPKIVLKQLRKAPSRPTTPSTPPSLRSPSPSSPTHHSLSGL